jgi:hypothetical protein
MTPAQRLLATMLGLACLAAAAHAQVDPGTHRDGKPTPAKKHHPAGRSPMQSDAMQDAMGVAMQAIRFGAENPNGSDADAKAAADAIMARVFSGELGAGPGASARQASQGRQPDADKDYGDGGD